MVARQTLPQKTQSHHNSEPLQQHSHQLHLLNPIAEAEAPKLSIQLVPREIAIAPDRYYLEVEFGGDRHLFPVQLTRLEVEELIEQAKNLKLEGGRA